MAKKYSKYNVYQGCTYLCNLKEGIEAIDAGVYTAENIQELEARIELYNKLFGGIGNTEDQQKLYKDKRDFILREQTEDEKTEYFENLQNTIAATEDDARKEFLERISSINPNSTAGKENGVPAYDKKKADDGGTTNQMTKYSRLGNLPILLKYRCTDDGVFVYSNTDYDYVRICQAVSIKSISSDPETSNQFIELEFYTNETYGEVKVMSMPAEELANGKYINLIKAGFSISNQKLFTNFINDLRYCGIKNKKLTIKRAALSYGFPAGENGGFELNKFVGIDDDCSILPLPAFEAYDKRILHSKGNLDDYIKFLSVISRGKYCIDFQLVVAASLSGIIKAYISEDTGRIAPGVFIFTGRSSIGKNILANIASSIWCLDGNNNLIASSNASTAFAAAMKDRQKVLPYIVADIQDLMNKGEDGIKGITSIIFEHSIGESAGRATTSGEVRNNKKIWHNNIIAFNENDAFTFNTKITGGASARTTIIPLGIVPEDKWLTENDPSTYWNLQRKASGVLGKAFVIAMREKNQDEICERFYDIATELKTEYDVQEKQALSLAMLILSYELAADFNLLPAEWEPITCKRIMDWIGGAKVITDMNKELYRLLCELAFKDTSFVANDDKSWKDCITANGGSEQAAFDSRYKDKNEVRGRKLYQKKQDDGTYIEGTREDHDRTLLLIPGSNLKQVLNYIKKTYEVIGAEFDPRSWAANGYLIPSGANSYTHKDSFKISVTFERSSKHRENYYAIILQEDEVEDSFVEEKATAYEEICLSKMKASLSIDAEVNRKICDECNDEKCIFVQKRKGA